MCGLRTRLQTDVDPPRVELPSAGSISSRRLRGDTLMPRCHRQHGQRYLTQPHCRGERIVQSYLPGGANVQPHLIHGFYRAHTSLTPANGIWISSAVLQGSQVRPIHRQTNHGTCDVCSNSPRVRFTKCLTIYHMIILSLS